MVASVKVFKKTSPNGKMTVYLGKRDYVDHLDHVDPIEGVLMIDSEYLKQRRVFAQVIVTMRYGRKQDEIMGVSFMKELCLLNEQVVPSKNKRAPSALQDKLLKKLGSNAHSFSLQLPITAPSSILLSDGEQPIGSTPSAPIGIEYDFRTFVGENAEDRGHKRSTVSMAIRKVQYAPIMVGSKQPSTMVSKGFTFSSGKMILQVTLDRELFYHGEAIKFNINIKNESKKTVKSITVSVVQNIEITVINGHYTKRVACMDTREGCPVTPGATLTKSFSLCPSVQGNRNERGIALDGYMKDEDAHLASSTLTSDSSTGATGFVVSYMARVKLHLGSMGGDLVGDVPFKLMHPAPGSTSNVGKSGRQATEKGQRYEANYDDDENIVFEDFARLRATT